MRDDTGSGGESSEDKESAFVRLARLSSLGLEMGVSVAVGWGLGYWLDAKLGTKPWLMLVGVLLGVIAGFKSLVQTARKAMRDKSDSPPPANPPAANPPADDTQP